MIDGTRLLLARHGRHDWLSPPINRLAGHLPGVHLNAAGRAEAGALARRLASQPPHRIVSSPVERTMETATIVAEALGLVVTTDARLTETWMSSWEGQAVPDIMARFPDQWQTWRTRPTQASVPGLEKVETLGERMLSAAADYLRLDGSTLLVSHQDPLLALVCRLLDLPLDAMRRMEISPGSLTVFEVAAGRPVLVGLNSQPGRVGAPDVRA